MSRRASVALWVMYAPHLENEEEKGDISVLLH